MTNRKHSTLFAAMVVGLMTLLGGCDEDSNDTDPGLPSTSPLSSASTLLFGPDGVLFIGDSYASKVIAVETTDAERPADPTRGVYVEDLEGQVAQLLGADPRQIVFNDLAVHPSSQNVYLAVHVGRSIDPRVAIVRLRRDDRALEVIDLEALATTEAIIRDAPAFTDTLQYGQSQRILTITDLTYYAGELFVAGVSNQEFASTIRRMPYPFDGSVNALSVEIFHTAHNQQETRAPIVTSIVHEIDGEPYLIAACTCTPLVRFRLADLQDGAHVVGDTIAELGYGNAPVDMFIFRGTPPFATGERLLITNDQRGAVTVSTACV